MTSKLKCPFCLQELESVYVENRPVFACCNLNCKGYFMNAPKELWHALIQAKQDLEIALTAIKEIAEECGCLMAALKSTGFESVVETFDKNIRKKLKQIEHKE